MKKVYVLFLVLIFLSPFAFAGISKQSFCPKPNKIDHAKEKEIKTRIGSLQIPFIKNELQIKDKAVKYYAKTFAGTVFITDNEILYGLKDWTIKEHLLNAKKTQVTGIEKAVTKVSYFKGKDQSNWKSNIPTYQEIGFGEVYDHIKLNLKAYGKNIEKLFIVEKDGKPEDITIEVKGAKGLKVNDKGELEIAIGMGTVKMTRPVAYQEIEGKRVLIPCVYNLTNFALKKSQLSYSFEVGSYNKDYSLIIDPLLASTFIGGSNNEIADAIAIDSQGNVFVAGYTTSSDFPTTPGAYDTSHNGGYDVCVSKLNNSLTTLIASTLIGGSNVDYVHALAIDFQGNVFVAGYTTSSDFPTTPGAYDTFFIPSSNSDEDIFISTLDTNLSAYIPPCTYSIDPLQQSFSPNGGSGSVNVTTNSEDCTWTAKSNASWITITSTSGEVGNGWVVFWVDPNPNSGSRTGTLTIGGETLTVIQAGGQGSQCSLWSDVISKYNAYVIGQAVWNEVITCYNQYASQ